MRFKGKLAVVTGAARGIGLACAARLAQDGAKVVLLDIEDEMGRKTAAEIGKTSEAHYLHCDVGQKAEVDQTFDEIFARHVGPGTIVTELTRDALLSDPAGIVCVCTCLQIIGGGVHGDLASQILAFGG
jgi:NAD(P)-dependent dehydrogenase (short-subunit alcohol dehydrogenase family)